MSGDTADPNGKGIAGSSKMASDGGSVIFGGEPLTPMEKNRGRSTTEKRRDWKDLGNVAFNDNQSDKGLEVV